MHSSLILPFTLGSLSNTCRRILTIDKKSLISRWSYKLNFRHCGWCSLCLLYDLKQDVGTGSYLLLPLLLAFHNSWHFFLRHMFLLLSWLLLCSCCPSIVFITWSHRLFLFICCLLLHQLFLTIHVFLLSM